MGATKKIDMQFMRYMNLFSRIARVQASHCFPYNNMIVFVVPKFAVERAIGKDNINLKKLGEIVEKRTRVIPEPSGEKDLQTFVKVLVSPIEFEKIEIVENEAGAKEAVITTAGREQKAMLIGRARARETEMKGILEQYFGVKNLRIN